MEVIEPFLTTTDLLRLSECSTAFLSSRSLLSRIKIVPHPRAGTDIHQGGLTRLLSGQQQQQGCQIPPRLGPRRVGYLRLGDHSLLARLGDLVGLGCCKGTIKTLNVSDFKLRDEDALCIGHVLSSGSLPALEELYLSGGWSYFTRKGLAFIMGALSSGSGPPQLRLLDMSKNDFETTEVGTWSCALPRHLRAGQYILTIYNHAPHSFSLFCCFTVAQPLAMALQSGHFHQLQRLNLANTNMHEVDFEAVTTALQSCPDLRSLDLSWCGT